MYRVEDVDLTSELKFTCCRFLLSLLFNHLLLYSLTLLYLVVKANLVELVLSILSGLVKVVTFVVVVSVAVDGNFLKQASSWSKKWRDYARFLFEVESMYSAFKEKLTNHKNDFTANQNNMSVNLANSMK